MHVMRLENLPGDCVPQGDCRDTPSIEVINNALMRGSDIMRKFRGAPLLAGVTAGEAGRELSSCSAGTLVC